MGIQLCQVLGNATQSEVGDVEGGVLKKREKASEARKSQPPLAFLRAGYKL